MRGKSQGSFKKCTFTQFLQAFLADFQLLKPCIMNTHSGEVDMNHHHFFSILCNPCCKEGVYRGGDPELLCPLMSHSVSRSVSPVCLSFCPAVCNRRPDFFLAGVAVGRSLVAVGMQRRDGGQGAGQIKVWRCMFCWIVCCLTAFD